MPSLNNVKDTIGLEAIASPGVPVALDYVVPITGLPGLDIEIGKEKDTAIIGRNMSAGAYKVSEDSKDGASPIGPRSVPALALIMHSLLGGGIRAVDELTGVEVGALVRIKYTGVKPSATFMVAEGATPAITAKSGERGAEAVDAGFGTAGVLTCTALTVASLVSTIAGYADFDAQFVMGDPSIVLASKLLNFGSDTTEREGKGNWCYAWISPATASGLYKYEIPVVLTSVERPTLTRQIDSRGQAEVWAGFVVDLVSLEASLQAFVTASMQGLAMYGYRPKILSGTTVSADATVTMIDTRELMAGMKITGTGIPAATTILSITTIDEFGTLELSAVATASGTVDLTVDLVEQTALTLENAKPWVFNDGRTSIDGSIIRFIRSMSLEMKNNHPTDTGYGQGSFARQMHQKGMFEATGSMQLALDASSLGLRNKALDDQRIGVSYEFRGAEVIDKLFEYMLVELPYVQLMNFTRPDNGGQLDASVDYAVIAPGGVAYNDPLKVTILVAQAAI